MIMETMVNGEKYTLDIDPGKRLIDFLREDLGLTGTKEGCGEGECGACTVIMNGVAVNSCLIFAYQGRNSEIITVEGLAKDEELDILQKSFIKNGAVQCGYCTPGMLMSSKALLMKNPNPTEEEIKIAISGNLCRCTGYTKIVRAVNDAANHNSCNCNCK
ncbi:(2Fe-2S)-binding protein [Clostridium sp. MSJ-11]|uniref:(2Fe-2S)-binding protein n=1 Tax=Clostridium mobile TaxID=2841512 RepID=A0ABS6EHN2_9CLOT|nr:(2Fe-2S)-binding protein [Clostridium mobile]MBU5484716.1 (2Fe-2S)-binding protein [Clostridium mobile]